MALNTMIEKLNEARRAYDAQLAEIQKQGAAAVAEHLAANVPPGYVLQWRQYTPYFNDGEPCRFSVHEPYLVRVGDVGKARHLEECGLELYAAVTHYGEPDKLETYRGQRYNSRTGKYDPYTEEYTVHGFPAIDGFPVERIQALLEAWKVMPKDLLERAFGDHVTVTIGADGASKTAEYEHD